MLTSDQRDALVGFQLFTVTLLSSVVCSFMLGIHMQLHGVVGGQYKGLLFFAMAALLGGQYIFDTISARFRYARALGVAAGAITTLVALHAVLAGREPKISMALYPAIGLLIAFLFTFFVARIETLSLESKMRNVR